MKVIATNSDARRNYDLKDKYQAGIVLAGTEVKSIRKSNVNLKNTYCIIKDDEMWILNMYIKEYEEGNIFNKDPNRSRKLLLTKKEILKIKNEVQTQKMSIIPTKIYFQGSLVKVEIALRKR